MYLKKLESWKEKDWEEYFKQYKKINTKDKKEKVKKILTSDSKEVIQLNFRYLKGVWIINGIWPWFLGAFFRNLLTFLFRGVKYERHDIDFGVWGNIKDYHESNYNLLNHSLKGLAQNTQKVLSIEINVLVRLLIFLFVTPFFILLYIIIHFSYLMVELFGKKAFRFTNK